MRRLVLAACAALMTGHAAPAPAGPDGPRMMTQAEAPHWHAVGRLNVAGNRFCSATLIAADLVLTSAHCLFNPLTLRQARPQDLRFVAGQWQQTYAALRIVSGLSIAPGFAPARGLRDLPQLRDLALLRLARPIDPQTATPLPVAAWPQGARTQVVAYGLDRAYIPSIRSGCSETGRIDSLVVLDCLAVPGNSGAPVIADTPDGPRLVGVVSARIGAMADHSGPTLAIAVLPLLETLKQGLPGG